MWLNFFISFLSLPPSLALSLSLSGIWFFNVAGRLQLPEKMICF